MVEICSDTLTTAVTESLKSNQVPATPLFQKDKHPGPDPSEGPQWKEDGLSDSGVQREILLTTGQWSTGGRMLGTELLRTNIELVFIYPDFITFSCVYNVIDHVCIM